MAKQVEALKNGAEFKLTTVNKDGKIGDSVTVKADKAFDLSQLGRKLAGEFSDGAVTTRRVMLLTMLAQVFQSPRLDGFRGKGDKTTGKTAPEMKTAVRDAESSFIAEMVQAGKMKLPAHNLGQEAALQDFLKKLRDDPHYSRLKVTVGKYYAFVGQVNVTPSGFLVPVAVMDEQVRAVLDIKPVDTSPAGVLNGLLPRLTAEAMDSTQVKDAIGAAKAIVSTLEKLDTYFRELANHAAGTAGEKGETSDDVIRKAAEKIKAAQEKAKAVA